MVDEKKHIKTESSSKKIERRDFLQGMATIPVLGAFAAALGHKIYSDKKRRKQPIKYTSSGSDLNVALLGAGAQGQELMNACLRIPGIRFKAVCDIWTDFNQKRAARRLKAYKHDVNQYVNYQEMLAKETDLDAVIIATPDFWHAEHTVACLNAGLHVYCEKEMSNTLTGARQMVQAAKRTGKLLQIGHQRRSNPRYQHVYNKLLKEANLLGRITTVNGQWNRSYQPDLDVAAKYYMDSDYLKEYGFRDMHQFLNWRWFKGLGGGPIVDLGSHQIDIYNWFLESAPKSVMASGGLDFHDKKSHEWYDNVMAIYEYETKAGTVRAYYQTLTTNSNQGYYEQFLGVDGSLYISESAGRGGIYREPNAPQWDKWINKGYIGMPEQQKVEETEAVLDVRETIAPPKHKIPVVLTDLYHQPHLENFFNTIRDEDTLNCPAEVGYESAVTVLKVNEAVEAGSKLTFTEKDYHLT